MTTLPQAGGSPRRIASRYVLTRAIGRGGMGVVWEAEDELLKRRVAVKEIQLALSGPARDRFRVAERVMREAQAAAQLGHHGAVTLYDVVEDDGVTFIVMELVEARTVTELVRQQGPMTPAAAARLGRQVLDALMTAHRRGIIHRDVKPANVMILPDGRSKLADFGIAKLGNDPELTQTGLILGSPAFMSPEQASGQKVTPATDLYGLGTLMYFAVEGEPPFERGSTLATLTAVVNSGPRPMLRAGALAGVIEQLMRKDPADRPHPAALRWQLDQIAGTGRAILGALEMPAEPASPPADAPTLDTTPTAAPTPEPPSRTRMGAAAAAPTPQAQRPTQVAAAEETQAQRPRASRWAALSDPSPTPRQPRWRLALLVAGFAILVAVTLSLDLVLPDATGRQEAAPPTVATPDTTTPPATADPGGAQASVPSDWTLYTDPATGYRIAHPPGWEVRKRSGNAVDLAEAGSGRYLRIDWSDQPRDPMEAWLAYEPVFAQQRVTYERVRLEPAGFRGLSSALWEYRYQDSTDGALLRAANLTFVDPGAEIAYALNFQTREPDWERSQDLFEQFKASFQPG